MARRELGKDVMIKDTALSLPRSFPIKAFQCLNGHTNELFSGKAESAISFFGGLGYPTRLL